MSEPWLERSVVVTVGTGGVGKTTTAAAIGLEAAARGRRTLVLTIDPARRLAGALGLETLDHEIRRVPPERIPGAEDAQLYATMLDTQRTFDDLVERLAPDAETRERILANPIYRSLTDALSGSREYSALEELYQLHDAGEYDLIVLDTPPASNALHFLDAPRRLTGFLDGSFLGLLVRPAAAIGRTSFRWFRAGSSRALELIQRLTGLGFLEALSEFLLAFEGLLGGVRDRAHHVERLLRGPACAFVLVAGPEPEQVRRAVEFWRRLRDERIRLAGLIVNRVHVWRGTGVEFSASARAEAEKWLVQCFDGPTAALLVDAASRHAERARRDAQMSERLERALPLLPDRMRRVPLLAGDVHSVEGLTRLRQEIFRPAGAGLVA